MFKEIVTLEVDGLTLSGQLYLPGDGDRSPELTVCICHGIPSGRPAPDDGGYPLLAEKVCRQGLAAFILNFRGAGASGGNLDILGWARDLRAVIDYLCALTGVSRSHLSLLGFSGGAAVSVYVAAQDKRVSSVVACACPAEFDFFPSADKAQTVVDHFRSIGAIRDDGFPRSVEEWFGGFGLVSPISHVSGIAPRPLLLVHGSQDDVVGVGHARRLYDRAGEPKQLVVVDGAGHGLRQSEQAMSTVIGWLKSRAEN